MRFVKLINWGLITVPFLSIYGQDIRELKLYVALGFCLALGLLAHNKGYFGKFTNKYALWYIAFIWVSSAIAPTSGLVAVGVDLKHFWIWKPLCYTLIMFSAIAATAGYRFTAEQIRSVIKTIYRCGLAMAILVAIQAWNIDQFFISNGQFHEQWNLGGTLGHPTFVSAFIAMTIPFAFFSKRRLLGVFMMVAVIATESQVAIGAMILSLAFYYGTFGKKQIALAIATVMILASLVVGFYLTSPVAHKYITTSGRAHEWKRIIKDINSPIREDRPDKYTITGRGLGSFKYTYRVKYVGCKLREAHNEYLEIAYNLGLAGCILFLLAIFTMIRDGWKPKNRYRMTLLSSFVCVAICAGGTFIWQLGAAIFYTVIVVGLLHNKYKVIGE